MKFRIIIPILLLVLLLTACAGVQPPESSAAPEPSESAAPSDESASTRNPECTPVDESELNALREFLGDTNCWNSQVLASGEFTDIKDINLYTLFHRGIPLEAPQEANEEEKAWYVSFSNADERLDVYRLPASEMDRIVQEYLQLPLSQFKGVGLENLVYREESDCYYFNPAGSNVLLPEITAAYRLADGSIQVCYHNRLESPSAEMVVTLLPEDGTYRFVSNLPAA